MITWPVRIGFRDVPTVISSVIRIVANPQIFVDPNTTDETFLLAALAIEHNCEWITADKGFARFPRLRRRGINGK